MKDFINRFSLNSIKFDYQVLAGMIFVWLVVVGAAIHSILQQDLPPRQRRLWICIVVLLPILGVLAYLPFSFKLEHYPDLFMWKKNQTKKN